MLKTKMHRPTSEIIINIAAASGSRTNPRRNGWSPNVNQVKFWTARNPSVRRVGNNTTTDIASAATCAAIASAAALLRPDFDMLRITTAAANGTAGNSQRLLAIPGFILLACRVDQHSSSDNAGKRR